MDELNAWDAEGFTEEQIMAICKEIYPINELVNTGGYTALIEPTIWQGNSRKIYVASGCGLCYDVEKAIGQRFQKAYYM